MWRYHLPQLALNCFKTRSTGSSHHTDLLSYASRFPTDACRMVNVKEVRRKAPAAVLAGFGLGSEAGFRSERWFSDSSTMTADLCGTKRAQRRDFGRQRVVASYSIAAASQSEPLTRTVRVRAAAGSNVGQTGACQSSPISPNCRRMRARSQSRIW